MASTARSTARNKVRVHRARLRKQGLAFARAAHLQSRAVANSRQAKEDQAFVDAISAWDAG